MVHVLLEMAENISDLAIGKSDPACGSACICHE